MQKFMITVLYAIFLLLAETMLFVLSRNIKYQVSYYALEVLWRLTVLV